MDLHDISRSSRTYGVKKFFLVNPCAEQHRIIERILGHWRRDRSREWHPHRHEALSLVKLTENFDQVQAWIEKEEGQPAEVVLTDAREISGLPVNDYRGLRSELESSSRTRPLLLVFGTGWGVAETFYPAVHRILAPLYGPGGKEGYNHLSVRAAVAAILDRLFGQ